MDNLTCRIDGCESAVKATGLCNAHYLKARKSSPRQSGARHALSGIDTSTREATCAVCGRVPVWIRASGRAECSVAKRDRKREARRGDAERGRRRGSNRLSRLREKYGLSPEDVAALEAQAGGRCLICDRDFGDRAYHVDHCHDTGAVRGLLCSHCNVGLGFFGDDPARLMSAHLYLIGSGKAA